jgi:putative ABC transport system permease protein
MKSLRLGLWLLRRERASGEWRVLLLALVIGVGSVSTTGFLGDRFKRAMRDEGARFLGADLLVSSPRPIESWPVHRLAHSGVLEFASMVSRGDAFQLATVRAIDAAYPLRGSVKIAAQPLMPGTPASALPPAGAIYVDQELLPLLGARVGDRVQLGAASVRIAGVITEEPGQLGGAFGLAPRVILRADEVAATRALQPGSRVTYLYQFGGPPAALEVFIEALKPRLDRTQRLIGTREGIESLRGAFAGADRYIQLAALVSLLLAVAAIAIAAHRHALRHYDQAALLRCMGATSGDLRALYLIQLGVIGLIGSLAGIALGAVLQTALAHLLLPGAVARLPALGPAPVGAGVASGFVALAGASLPALLRLLHVPPLRVLRRDLPPLPRSAWASTGMSLALLFGLTAWYAGEPKLVGIFGGVLAALALLLVLLAQFALGLGRLVRRMSHGPLRFGLAQLLRHRFESTLQLAAFTLALFLVALLALVQSDLVAGWRQQMPADAPDHFLVNIAPHQQRDVAAFLTRHRLAASELYPMVRGRLATKNGQAIETTLPAGQADASTLRRELNLSHTATLPANNRIIAGQWFGDRRGMEISVEAGMAQRLGLALGDELGFAVGDQTVRATITSLRSVRWDSMQPNFFVIFAAGPLDGLPTSYLAGVRIRADASAVLPEFVRSFPGVTVLALDKLIAQVGAVFDQITSAVQLLLGFLLAAGMAVVVATLLASLDARRQEAVLLRTLGAQRAYLARALSSEFVALGLLAGLLASALAEAAMALIAQRLFDLPVKLHPWLWLALPAAGAALIGASGWLTTRHIVRVPPMQSLRTFG